MVLLRQIYINIKYNLINIYIYIYIYTSYINKRYRVYLKAISNDKEMRKQGWKRQTFFVYNKNLFLVDPPIQSHPISFMVVYSYIYIYLIY